MTPRPADPRIATAGAFVAAVLSSACCWLPLLLVGVGVSAGGVAAAFEAYRTPLLIGTGGLLATAFYFVYRPERSCSDGVCAAPNRTLQRLNRGILWVTTVMVLGFATFPLWMHTIVGPTPAASVPESPGAVEVRFSVAGMHCKGCTGLLETELAKIPGVVSAKVNYGAKQAVVSIELGVTLSDAAVNHAGEVVGFQLRRQ